MTLQVTFGEEYGLPTLDTPVADRIECAHCGEHTRTVREAPSGSQWCEPCFDDTFTECVNCADIINRGDARTSDNDDDYCESCYNSTFVDCHSCGEETDRSSAILCRRNHYCEPCYSEIFGECDGCGYTYLREVLSYHEDSGVDYCESCYPSDSDDCDSGDCDCGECSESRGTCRAAAFRFLDDDTCERTGSLRTYGVELETSACNGFGDLNGRTNFTAKYDGSIRGKEFVSNVLRGDRGLDAIAKFCDLAKKFKVDDTTGYHLHIGVRDLTDDQRRAVCVGYALTQSLWFSLVPKARRENTYCRALAWSASDVADCQDFHHFAATQVRYQYFNVAAFASHNTFEVRLHSGTLDASKVNNWVRAHVKFLDWCANNSLDTIVAEFSGRTDQAKFDAMCRIWGDDDLCEFYRQRAAKFGTEYTLPSVAVS